MIRFSCQNKYRLCFGQEVKEAFYAGANENEGVAEEAGHSGYYDYTGTGSMAAVGKLSPMALF